jgi:hypothetical protein
MTTKEAMQLIDKVGLLRESRGMRYLVRISDVKERYGSTRFLVSPTAGDGEVWVDAGQVTFEETGGAI